MKPNRAASYLWLLPQCQWGDGDGWWSRQSLGKGWQATSSAIAVAPSALGRLPQAGGQPPLAHVFFFYF